ncbi:hypothetical protein [Rhizobium sp. CECT 9324]|uniref:hypothetical protein n=1 Tax=Rhizobium sp. CECT 9324 TaxID=2845820 RepID=UPI001E44524C|nr:hypothetical protein [Rhizobium sp. CECT 9324]CAH0343707.1 hypothetical protein RHI9324_05444 [Rhizobium sp. CECT 9324]
MTTYAIAVGVDTDELRVMETDDNFGAFDTREAAAARMIEMIDGRMETLRPVEASCSPHNPVGRQLGGYECAFTEER